MSDPPTEVNTPTRYKAFSPRSGSRRSKRIGKREKKKGKNWTEKEMAYIMEHLTLMERDQIEERVGE